jgi:hypothetical protein
VADAVAVATGADALGVALAEGTAVRVASTGGDDDDPPHAAIPQTNRHE